MFIKIQFVFTANTWTAPLQTQKGDCCLPWESYETNLYTLWGKTWSFLKVQQVVCIVTTMHSIPKWSVQPWTGDSFLDCVILLHYIYQDSTHIQGVARLEDITAGGDFPGLCD